MWATTKPSLEALLLLARLISTIIPTTCAIHAPLPDSLGAHTTSISSRHLTDTEAPAFAPAPAPAAFDDYDYSGSYDYGSEEPVADFPLLPDLELVPAPSEGQPPRDPKYRGLKMAFHYNIHPSRENKEGSLIRNKLMPSVAAILQRSIKVRRPTGPLTLDQMIFPVNNNTVTTLLDALNMTSPAEADSYLQSLDADFLLAVDLPDLNGPICRGGAVAFAFAVGIHNTTFRPLFGTSGLCENVDFGTTRSAMVHETLHAIGFVSELFRTFRGYTDSDEIVQVLPEKFDPNKERAGTMSNETLAVVTPNVARVVREHFACNTLAGAELEDDGGPGSAYAHWEERIFQGSLMDPTGEGFTSAFVTDGVLTDLTLALLQDSGWYDVRYGSAGWNSYGYNGGCAFANGTRNEALASPEAARYLCKPEQAGEFICAHDHVVSMFCDDEYYGDYHEGFHLPTISLFDAEQADSICVEKGSPAGSRCVKPKKGTSSAQPPMGSETAPQAPPRTLLDAPAKTTADAPAPDYSDLGDILFERANKDDTMCVAMTCSPEGNVLINGIECNPEDFECPDSGYLCEDPGVLTCAETLSDCSGQGDCFKGACYCHFGWGGADCSVPLCIPSDGCPDGSECPESGFCGVPQCGTWSQGPDDIGTPCNGGTVNSIGSDENSEAAVAESQSSPAAPTHILTLLHVYALYVAAVAYFMGL